MSKFLYGGVICTPGMSNVLNWRVIPNTNSIITNYSTVAQWQSLVLGSTGAQSLEAMSKRIHSPQDPDTRGICCIKWMDPLRFLPLR